jgi:predicted dehydrogenase
MEKVKIGVIGIGHLGTFHTKILKENEHFRLVGIYDENQDHLRRKASELNVTPFDDLDTLFHEVDAVSIAATTSAHYDLLRRAIHYSKHIFVEKPITAELKQAKEIVQLADQKGIILQVGHIERFNPAMIAIKDIELNPVFIESHRLAPFTPRGADVAVVLDLMIHDIDLILNLVKSPVKEIQAAGVNIISDSEDISNCRLIFENGCVANVTASRISMKKMRKMRIFQQGAYLGLDFNEGSAEIFYIPEEFKDKDVINGFPLGKLNWGNKEVQIHGTTKKPENINPLKEELEHFAICIKEKKRPLVDGHEAVHALQVAETILQRIEEHREYTIKHMNQKSPGL